MSHKRVVSRKREETADTTGRGEEVTAGLSLRCFTETADRSYYIGLNLLKYVAFN